VARVAERRRENVERLFEEKTLPWIIDPFEGRLVQIIASPE